MYVNAYPRLLFPGEVLGPQEINEIIQYAADALIDAADRRYTRTSVTIDFSGGISGPLTEAATPYQRTFVFQSPNAVFIERATLRGNYSSSDTIAVSIIATFTGLPPDGANAPWITAPESAAPSDDVEVLSADAIYLAANTEYLITVTPAGTMTLNKLDLELHLSIDRWTLTGTTSMPEFVLTGTNEIRESEGVDATEIDAIIQNLDDEVSQLADSNVGCYPVIYQFHNVVTATDADLRTKTIPRVDSDRAQGLIRGIHLSVHTSDTLGGNVTAIVKDHSGTTLDTRTCSMSGTSQASDRNDALALSIAPGTTGVTADTSKDWTLTVANAGANTASKITVILWISR